MYILKNRKYRIISEQRIFAGVWNVLKISTFEVALLIVTLYMLGKGKEFSRTVFIVFYVLEVVFDWIVRYWYKEYFNTKHKGNGTSQKLLLITTSDKVTDILKSMNENYIKQSFKRKSGLHDCSILTQTK